MTPFKTAVSCVVCALLFVFTADAAVITEIKPTKGSINGMTRLTVLGKGFDIRGRSNDIYIGSSIYGVFCDPVPNECHEERIVCLTDPYSAVGDMPLSVRSHGFLADCQVSGGCSFEYTLERTPEVVSINPQWLVAPGILTVTGSRFSQGDATVGNFDFTMHLGDEERCDLENFKVSSSSFKCNLNPMKPGTLPVDIQMGAYGRATLKNDKVVHLFPSYSGISPSSGSVNGGQRVTISGTSFSPILSDNFVKIHGAPCTVVEYNQEDIVCITSPNSATSAPAPTVVPGKARLRWWYNLPGNYLTAGLFNKVQYLFPSGTKNVDGFNFNGAPSCDNCAFEWTSMFLATESGEHTFYGVGDDEFEFWVSEDETPVERKMDYSVSGNPADSLGFNPKRIFRGMHGDKPNGKVTLEANKKYWIRALLKEGGGGQTISVTVKAPSATEAVAVADNLIAYQDDWMPPVEVYVRDTKAMIDGDCLAWGSCNYEYAAASTPAVTAVTAAPVAPGAAITITGSGFSTLGVKPTTQGNCDGFVSTCGGGGCSCNTRTECEKFDNECAWNSGEGKCTFKTATACNSWSTNRVLIAGNECAITSVSATQIVCTVPYVAGGFHEANVFVDGKGKALGQVFVTIQASIRKISPASGSVNGANELSVIGGGFDAAAGVSTVTVNGANCPVTSIDSFQVKCTIPAGSAGNAAVKVSSKKHITAAAADAFQYVEDFVVPGTTVVTTTTEMTPKSGSTSGGTEVSIVLPTQTSVGLTGTSVSFGGIDCDVTFSMGREVVCRTGSTSASGIVAGSLTYVDKHGQSQTVTLPSFNYVRSVWEVTQESQSINGGGWVKIGFDTSSANRENIKIAIEGQQCQKVNYYNNYVYCLVPPQPRNVPATTALDKFDFNGDGNAFTNKLGRVDYSSNVFANADGTVTIPKGGYVNTKGNYKRPFVFTARVKATADKGKINIRALVKEPTFSVSGVRGTAGAHSDGRMGMGIDEWFSYTSDKAGEDSLAGVGLDKSAFHTYRLEAWNNYLKFFIDNTLVKTVTNRGKRSGSVGIGFNGQDVIVDDFEIRSLYPRALQVNVSGTPLNSNYDIMYSNGAVPKITRLTPTSVTAGSTKITITGSNIKSKGGYKIYALKSATEAITSSTPVLCSPSENQNVITEKWELRCTVSSGVEAGDYFFQVTNRHGAAESAISGEVKLNVASIEPKEGGSGGSRITVKGGGFLPTATVKAGSATCAIASRNAARIVCDLPATNTSHQVSVEQGGSSTSCGNGCKYTKKSTAPYIASATPLEGGAGTVVTFSGVGFPTSGSVWGYAGETPMSCSRSGQTVRCTLPFRANGNAALSVSNGDGFFDGASVTFRYKTSVTGSSPSTISTVGGQTVTISGSFNTASGANGVSSKTFNNAQDGWSSSDIHKCNAGSMAGRFAPEQSFSKSFSGIASHSFLRVQYKVLSSNPTPVVYVDSTRYTLRNKASLPNSCGSTSDNNYLYEGSLVVPHTAASAVISFATANNNNGWWGVLSYRLDTIASLSLTATVGSKACPVTYLDDTRVKCAAPAGADAASSDVRLTIGSTAYCTSCSATYAAANSPTPAAATIATAEGVSTTIPEFGTTGVSAKYTADGAQLQKVTSSNSWNGGAIAPLPIQKTDGDVVGVEWKVSKSDDRYMMGLATGTTSSTTSYTDIDFAVYVDRSSFKIYENGRSIGTYGSVWANAVVRVVYEKSCNCVRYYCNGAIRYTSQKAVVFPLVAEASIHNAWDKIENIKLVAPQTAADRIAIAGTGIKNGAGSITVTPSACLATYQSNGVASCWVAPGTVSVGAALNIQITNSNGAGAATSVTVSHAVESLSHTSGSKNGGHRLVITGSAFDATTVVSLTGAGTCSIESFSARRVVCRTPQVSGAMEAAVSIANGATAFSCVSSIQIESSSTVVGCDAVKYSYTDAATPSVTSVSPTSASSGAVLTFLGTNFIADDTDVVISIGSGVCKATAVTSTSITCTLENADAGNYNAVVGFTARGQSNGAALAVPLSVSSASSTAAGNQGGAVVVLTGTGFGKAASTTAATVKVGGVDLCSSIARADTTLTCTTAAGDFNGAITVTVNGVSANGPTFVAAAGNAASISSVTPTTGGAGAVITISGSNLGASTVKVGDADCTEVSSSATSVVCAAGPNMAAGIQAITVTTNARGVATGSVSFTAVLSIVSVAPSQGSKLGGTSVTVMGSGFGTSANTEVTLGGVVCAIQSITAGKIVCNSGVMGDADNRRVVVSVTDANLVEINAPAAYVYDTSLTATVTSINPTSGSASGEELVTITGTDFSDQTFSNQVTIGGARCDMQEVNVARTQIICRNTARAPIANAAVDVIISNQGRATSSVTFAYELQIDSIVGSADVSLEGGRTVTFTGKGFWSITNESDWKWKRYELTVGGIVCPIVSSTSTQIVCNLGASPREIVEMATLVNAYPARTERSVGVALTGNGIDATVAGGVVVNFRASATASITSVTPKNSQVNKGAVFTIAGSGFAASGNKVNVGQANCVISSETSTRIVCQLNEGVIGRGFVQVTVPNQGKASTVQSCPAGQYLLCDGTCVSDAQCQYAEWGMENCAELMYLIVHDTFCHSNGGTDRVNKPFRTDADVEFNVNCPMYSCEGKDCNQTLSIGGRGGRISTCGSDPNGFYADYRAKITGASPKASSLGGGRRITVTGEDFGTDVNAIQAFVGTSMCVVLEATGTQFICETTAGTGSGLSLRVAVKNLEASCSSCDGFSYSESLTPVITEMSPGTNAVAGAALTITGTGFSATASDNTVSVGAANCAVTSASATEIVCTAPRNNAGTKAVRVKVLNKGLDASDKTIKYRFIVDGLDRRSGSTVGGATVVVRATGVDANTRVMFGDCESKFVSFTSPNLITVVTAACDGKKNVKLVKGSSTTTSCATKNACTYDFSSSKTPTLTAFSATGNTLALTVGNTASAAQADLSVTAGDATCTISSYANGVIACDMPASHAAGAYNVIVTVAALGAAKPDAALSAQFTYTLGVGAVSPASGSRGGNQLITIGGSNFDANTKENNKVTIGGAACVVVSATSTEVQCRTGKIAAATTVAPQVTVEHPAQAAAVTAVAAANTYAYDDAKTPVVTAVTPNRGSTAGGTQIEIGGSGLTKNLVVTIDGIVCTQSAGEQAKTDATAGSALFCTTGAHKTMFEPQLVRVATAADGDAYNTAGTYQYIDLWSRWTTWGNTPPPIFADSAVISEGQTVMVDYSPPRFHLIIVMGHLILDDTVDIELECTYIMINFGRMTVGTPEKPFNKKATIRLYGDRLTPEIPVHGAKVLALRHGALDIHGTPRQKTWTELASTAAVGAAAINVKGPIDWKVGEWIVMSSTDYKPLHAEHRRIVGVVPADGQAESVELQLEYALNYEHFGERQCFDQGTKCIDQIAEVGLLTRNVKIEGDKHTARLGFGATAFLMPLGESQDRYARLSYMEFANGGQQFIVGRYPVHYHVTGSSNTSYVNGTAVHGSLNRAFSVHGISNNTYVNNVAYDTAGHSLFIEDGSEQFNVITDNFICVSRVSTSNLNTDLTPANFWLVSPNNYIARNRAGGSQAYGFWISPFHPHSTGPTFSPNICPATHKLWAFEDNKAHSNKKYGVNIFQFWWPKKTECDFNGEDEQAILRNVVVYKNQIWGVTHGNHEVGQVGSVIYDNLTSADNGWIHPDGSNFWIEKIKAKNMTCGLQNSVLIALTNNAPFRRKTHRRGVNLPLGDNFFTENVTFINYDNENYGFEPQAWAARFSLCFPWGWDAVSRGLRWVDSPNRVRFRFHHHGILNDDDGTLSGEAGSQLVPHAPMFDDIRCKPATGYNTLSKSLVCPQDYKIRRFGISGMNELWTDERWQVTGSGVNRVEIVPEILRGYLVTAPINHELTVDFQWWYTPSKWDWKYGGKRFMQPGEKALFKVFYNSTRHHVYGTFDGKLNKTWNAPMPTLDETESRYAFDNETMLFRGLLHYPTSGMSVQAFNCPDEGCPLPPLPPKAWEKPCTPFDDPSGWSSGEVPADGAEVFIPYTDHVCLGKANATAARRQCAAGQEFVYNFNSIRVEGGLSFVNANCPCQGAKVILKVEYWMWVRNGGIVVGTDAEPITDCTFQIIFGLPPWNTEDKVLMAKYKLNPFGFRTLAVEAGMLSLHGEKKKPVYTSLSAVAAAGATTIALNDAVNWKVGDVIAIAGTSRELMYQGGVARNGKNQMEQSETKTITAISADMKTLTIDSALEFSHHGEGETTLNGVTYNVGAEVSVLTRTVSVEGGHTEEPEFLAGWRLNVGCTPDNMEGCAVGDDDSAGWPMEGRKPGWLRLDNVLLKDVGQAGVMFGSINVDGLTEGGEDDEPLNARNSYIREIAMWKVYNQGIFIRDGTTQLNVLRNTIYDVYGDGVRVASPNNQIEGNLVMKIQVPVPNCDDTHFIFEDCRNAGFRVQSGNYLKDNIVASGVGAGFYTTGISCDQQLRWSGNRAHSVRDGFLVATTPYDPWYRFVEDSTTPKDCRKIGGVLSYWSGDHGLSVWYAKGNIEIENYVSVDNAIGSMVMTLHSGRFQSYTPTAKYTNVAYAGYFDNHKCRSQNYHYKCKKSLMDGNPWCTYFQASTPYMGNIGMMETLFTTDSYGIGKTKGEHKFRWSEMDSYAAATGQAIVNGIHFANFDGTNECGLKDAGFYQNVFSNDTFHAHTFEKVTQANNNNGGLLWTRRTYGEKHGHWYLDFDDITYGGFWPDSPNKIWLTDKDGSLTGTGKATSILSSETITRNTQFKDMRYDGRAFQAGRLPVARDGCTWKSEWNAFQCDENHEWMSIAIDSLADDELTRRAAPVVLCKGDGMIEINGDPICQGGVVDYVSGPVMKGKTQRATLDRMSRWRFLAENNGNYTLSFRGVPPTHLRFTLDNFEYLQKGQDVGLTLNLRYFGENSASRVGVYVDGKRVRPNVGFDYPWLMNPAQSWPSGSDPQGTHFHDKYANSQIIRETGIGVQRNVFSFSLRPGSVLELKQEPIIQINMNVAVPESEFFNNKETFVAAMASVLGIDESRLKFAKIVPGTQRRRQSSSTDITVEVDVKTSDVQNAFDSNSDPSTDFDAILAKLNGLGGSGTIGSYSVSGISATVITPKNPRPPIRVVSGTPYVALNMTKAGTKWNTTQMQKMAHNWVLTNLADMGAPFNVTEAAEIALTSVYTDKDTQWTQVAIVMAYENNTDTKIAMDEVFANINKTIAQGGVCTGSSECMFAGWTLRDVQFSLNGWVPEGTEPAKKRNTIDQETLIKFVIGLGIGIIVVFALGGSLMYYCLAVRPKRMAEDARKRKMAMHTVNKYEDGHEEPAQAGKNPAAMTFSPEASNTPDGVL